MLKYHLSTGVRKGALSQEDADKKFEDWLDEKNNRIQSKIDNIAKEESQAKSKALEAEKVVNSSFDKAFEELTIRKNTFIIIATRGHNYDDIVLEQAVKTGLGLNAKINLLSVFDRKNYFYADLPAGYQISQYKNPIVGEGEVTLDMPYGSKKIGIERLHLEQDAGKSIHDLSPDNTFVDLNRSGIALMEIVSKPDLRSPDEVNAYVKKLRSIMRYLGTCDGTVSYTHLTLPTKA